MHPAPRVVGEERAPRTPVSPSAKVTLARMPNQSAEVAPRLPVTVIGMVTDEAGAGVTDTVVARINIDTPISRLMRGVKPCHAVTFCASVR